MKENEPVRVRIKNRKQAGTTVHDLTATIKLTVSDNEFWQLIQAYKRTDPTSFLYSIYLFEKTIQEEKQGILGKTIKPERENNPQNVRPMAKRNEQGPDRGDSEETGETETDPFLKLGDKEKTSQLPPVGLTRGFSRETGFYTPTEAGA